MNNKLLVMYFNNECCRATTHRVATIQDLKLGTRRATRLTAFGAFLGILAAPAARADQFVCQTLDGHLEARVHNHTQPTPGIRSVAIMGLWGVRSPQEKKALAVFNETDGMVLRDGTQYVTRLGLEASAQLDAAIESKGLDDYAEALLGTDISRLRGIAVKVRYNYRYSTGDRYRTTGVLMIARRDGETIVRDVNCVRYLK